MADTKYLELSNSSSKSGGGLIGTDVVFLILGINGVEINGGFFICYYNFKGVY